jgi:hypothetical protein
MATIIETCTTDIKNVTTACKFAASLIGTDIFTRKTFDLVIKPSLMEQIILPYSLDTYINYGLIKVHHTDYYTVYGIKPEHPWDTVEVIPEMTSDMYGILPKKIQDMIVVQQRKRNYYVIDFDYLTKLTMLRDFCESLMNS